MRLIKTPPDTRVTVDIDLGTGDSWRPQPTVHRRPPLIAAAVAAVVSLASVGVLVRGDIPADTARTTAADPAAVLASAASAAERADDHSRRTGKVLLVVSRQFELDGPADGDAEPVAIDQLLREWAPAGTRSTWLLRMQDNKPDAPVTELRGRCGDYYPAPDRDPCTRPGLWPDPTPAFVAGLPREPSALLQRLRADVAAEGVFTDQEALIHAAQALDRGSLPPRVRAALYRALALLPGLTAGREQIVLDGHAGIGVGLQIDGSRAEIVVDPGTGEYVGRRRVLTEPQEGLPRGTVVDATAVHTAVVNRVGEQPDGSR